LLVSSAELSTRVARMRKKFAVQYGFVVPEIKVSDSLTTPPKSYQIKIHGAVVATHEVRIGEYLIVNGDGKRPDTPGEEVREPAFGMKAYSISETFVAEAKRCGFNPIDNMSALLTHLSEVLRNNLAQLLSYRDMRALFDRLGPEYKRLLDEISPSQISYSGLQAVLKLLLAERISIRNLHLILEAIAEISPHARRAEQIAEHVRLRLAQQICGDLTQGGALKILRLGNRWDLVFHQSLKRDAKGDVIEFDIDPRLVEEFGEEATKAIRRHMDKGEQFVIVAAPDSRPYVRMIVERLFATLPVLSHLELARGVEIKSLGTIA
jgi:flagellar biosynthesis protein FlhA